MRSSSFLQAVILSGLLLAPVQALAEFDRAKHERNLDAALKKLDADEPLLARDHTALKIAAKERRLSELKVCADPANLPLSNNKKEGFQNKIAEVLAAELDASLVYFWRPYFERGLSRLASQTKDCDVLMGIPADYESLVTTEPIYRTTYVLAWRNDLNLDITSFDDPALREKKVGVFQTSALRQVLKERGITENVVIQPLSRGGETRKERQPWFQVQQVVDGEIDIAGVWGPFAGWLASKGAPITVKPVNLMEDAIPLEFSVAMGVRRSDQILRYKIELALDARKKEIEQILRDFGVPLVICSKCYVPGDLAAHGVYEKPVEAELQERDPDKIAEHQRVTRAKLKAWLAEGADIQLELANATLAGDPDRIRFLAEKGADLNALDNQGYAPIHTASRSRDIDTLKLLLDLGANPDTKDGDGYTAILHAALRDHVPTIEALTQAGADTEVRASEYATPLGIAIAEDHYAAAIALVEGGADPNSRNAAQALTPLMLISGREKKHFTLGAGRKRIERLKHTYPTPVKLARALIKKGADVNAITSGGVTALMLAAAKNQIPIVGLLVQSGADPEAKNGVGQTAMQLAKENGNVQLAGLLKVLQRTKRKKR
ncbi:MAG: quinoprotein dehydrogenase-associated putative ABC transporter substrate-binding protein [Filomicrobium sp.]